MEIIEIGAVRLDARLEAVDEFDAFVRPVVEPRFNPHCTRLTSVSQAEVETGDPRRRVRSRGEVRTPPVGQ